HRAGKVTTQCLLAAAIGTEPALDHAAKHDVPSDERVERAVGVPFEIIVSASQEEFVGGFPVVVAPRELHVASTKINLFSFRVLDAIGLALAMVIFFD